MTPLSRWALTNEEEGKIKRLFLKELVRINVVKEMESLLKALLSESEYLMVAKRLVAFVLVDEGHSDMQIAGILHVTRATSTRFRMVYKHAKEKQEVVVNVVARVKGSEASKQILKDILFKYALPAALGRIPKKGIF